MTTLNEAAALAAAERGLAVVSTVRADGTVQASLVNVGLLPHPVSGEPSLGFTTYGKVKLGNLRARPQLAVTFRNGWQWATVEGRAQLVGPDDPRPWLVDGERLRLLLREVFTAAGGTHDDWDEYDRVMAQEQRAVVLITPTRIYSNGCGTQQTASLVRPAGSSWVGLSRAAAMIARSVRRQRPQSPPAPHTAATSLEVDAPRATASHTVWLVTPTHKHTYISKPPADAASANDQAAY